MTQVYFNNWTSKADMLSDFFPYDTPEMPHVDTLFAIYGTTMYEGEAFVLFRDTRDGNIYEVNAYHCSCYDLEYQWEPEICDIASIRHRAELGNLLSDWEGSDFDRVLLDRLDELAPKQEDVK